MQSYLNLLSDIMTNGEEHEDRTGVGTLSVFGRQWCHDMRGGFPLLTTKRLPFRWIAEELFWFLSGSTNERDLRNRGVDIWQEWATEEQCAKFGRKAGDLGPVYGALWRRFPIGYTDDDLCHNLTFPAELTHGVVDQIKMLLHNITFSPSSRRLIVSGWHPYYQERVALPPCHTLWQCKVHEASREISLHLYARSIDSFLGLPFNIASYGLLLTLIATVTNLTPRSLIISFGDVHIYKNHLDQVKEQLSRTPKALPVLLVNPFFGSSGLDGLLSIRFGDLNLTGYDPHPLIKADVAV